MAFIPVPNTCQAELVFNFDGEVAQNVLHYEKTGDWSLDDMTELAVELVNWWNTEWRNRMPTTVSLTEVKCIDISSQDGPVLNYTTGIINPGLAGGAQQPNNVSLVVTKRTAKRGRSFRGRIYTLGLTEGDVTGSTVSGPVVTDILARWELIREFNLAVAGPAAMVVVSRQQGGSPLLIGETTNVTNFTSDGRVDTQRRRLPSV